MIEWNCNFNIENSIIQLDKAYIKVIDYVNINGRSEVNIQISDITGLSIVREYTETFDRTFNNDYEIYEELLLNYNDAEIVDE